MSSKKFSKNYELLITSQNQRLEKRRGNFN
nr:MAG TPA: hypothetical protein [Caudoviricetes sp.]